MKNKKRKRRPRISVQHLYLNGRSGPKTDTVPGFDIVDDKLDIIMEIDKYKRKHPDHYIAITDVIKVMEKLGWVRTANVSCCACISHGKCSGPRRVTLPCNNFKENK